MAYDQYLGERVNKILLSKNIDFYSKKMSCRTQTNKKYGDNLLIAKIDKKHLLTKAKNKFAYL